MKTKSRFDRKYWLGLLALLGAGLFFRYALVGYSFLAFIFFCLAALLTAYKLIRLLRKRKPKLGKVCGGILNTCVAIGLTIVIVVGCFVAHASFGDAETLCEYVVVLGAGLHGSTPSRSLRERLKAAGAYLTEHPDVICIVSGGQGPDEDLSEAQCMYHELEAMGIDTGRIWIEDQSTSTQENLAFSMALIEQKTGTRPTRIGVLSSEYHLLRASLFAKEQGVEAIGIPARTTLPVLFLNYFLREIAGICHYYVFGG